MGRGRQKAKQAKVARDLKYHTSPVDVEALQRELSAPGAMPPTIQAEEDDPYARYYGDAEDSSDSPDTDR